MYQSSAIRVFRLKTAATHEELERLTADYLAAGNKVHHCAPKKRRGEMSARERREQERKMVWAHIS
jgi:hypothetical protein